MNIRPTSRFARPGRALSPSLAVVSIGAMFGCTESPTPEGAMDKVDPIQIVTVSAGTNLALAANPSGDTLVLSLQGTLFTLPITGGAASAITDQYHDAREPVWSPDGSQIAFQGYRDGDWDLFTVAASGGTPVQITVDAFDDREPHWSSDGSALVFSSDRSGNYDIWSRNQSDGRLTQLTNAAENEHSPALAANGALAWATQISRAKYELRVMAADGSQRTLVTESGVISAISWTPAADAISYHLLGRLTDGSPYTVLKLAALDGTTQAMSQDASDVFPFRAAWLDQDTALYTADGGIARWHRGEHGEIAFSADLELRRPEWERRRRNHDDRSEQRALGIVSPVISPDGNTIIFSALGDLWRWQPATDSLERLTDDPSAEQMPAFSPDGRKLAYVGDQRGANELIVLDLLSNTHQIVESAGSGVSFPSWAPDSASIAMFHNIPGNPLGAQLMVTRLRDGEQQKIGGPTPAQPISWSADGLHVAATVLAPYSSRYREGIYQLVVAPLAAGATARVVPVPHQNILDAALTPDATGMTYVTGAQIWSVPLDENFALAGPPKLLSTVSPEAPADAPSWSAGGDHMVYMSGARMLRLQLSTGTTEDITPILHWHRDQPQETWVLRAGRLFDGEHEQYQRDVDILIRNQRIVSIGPMDPDTVHRVVDASGYAVIPGLFEMHAHMGPDSGFLGQTLLAWGVTTVRDPGANPYLARARQESWDSGRRVGPRTHITGYVTDGNRVFYSISEGVVSRGHLERALRRTADLKLDFIKTYVRLPDHWQARVVEFAHGIGIPVSSHELFPAVAHGMDHVEHIGGTSRRGYAPKVSYLGNSYGDVVDLLSESGMGITATAVLPGFAVIAEQDDDLFESRQFLDIYGDAARQQYIAMMRRFGAGAAVAAKNNGALLRELTDRGALLVTGTDSPFVPYAAGLHAELRLFERAGLTPFEVLHTATVQSARAAGVDADLGTLAPGMLADLVVIDGDPLAQIADADNVVLTVKNGRAHTLDELLAAP